MRKRVRCPLRVLTSMIDEQIGNARLQYNWVMNDSIEGKFPLYMIIRVLKEHYEEN